MNNKITMYELLGLVKDGQAPKRIKVTGNVYEYDDEFDMYMCDKKTYKVALGGMENEINLICDAFNEIVEILDNKDEEKKIPEKIPLNYADDRKPEEVYEYLRCSYNQLIDYLKSKGDE